MYYINKSLKFIWKHKMIYVLLCFLICFGVAMFVYASHTHYSIEKQEEMYKMDSYDLYLDVASDEISDENSITYEQYGEIVQIPDMSYEMYISYLDFAVIESEIKEIYIVFKDLSMYEQEYSGYILSNAIEGIGEDIQLLESGIYLNKNDAGTLEEAPKRLQFFLQDMKNKYSNVLVLPIEELKNYDRGLQLGTEALYFGMNTENTPNADEVQSEILRILDNEQYTYKFTSPYAELLNNTRTTRQGAEQVQYAGILILIVSLICTISSYRLLLGKKIRSVGICMALGAKISDIKRELYFEIFAIYGMSCICGALIGTVLLYLMPTGVEGTITLKWQVESFVMCIGYWVVVSYGLGVYFMRQIKSKKINKMIRG